MDDDQVVVSPAERYLAFLAVHRGVIPAGYGRRPTTVRTGSTANRHRAGLYGPYDFRARVGVALADSLMAWRKVLRGSYKPSLRHVIKGRPIAVRPVKPRAVKRLPRTLTGEEVTIIARPPAR